jgi:hypothetical protein
MPRTKTPDQEITELRDRRERIALDRAAAEGSAAEAKAEQVRAGTRHREHDIAAYNLKAKDLLEEDRDVVAAMKAVVDANIPFYTDKAKIASERAITAQNAALAALEAARDAEQDASDRWQTVRAAHARTGREEVSHVGSQEWGPVIDVFKLRIGGTYPVPGGSSAHVAKLGLNGPIPVVHARETLRPSGA